MIMIVSININNEACIGLGEHKAIWLFMLQKKFKEAAMGLLCDSDKPLVLSSSNIGNISRCGCCNFYHLCIGNITLRPEHKYLLTLTQMIIEALETSSAEERRFSSQLRNQA